MPRNAGHLFRLEYVFGWQLPTVPRPVRNVLLAGANGGSEPALVSRKRLCRKRSLKDCFLHGTSIYNRVVINTTLL